MSKRNEDKNDNKNIKNENKNINNKNEKKESDKKFSYILIFNKKYIFIHA